MKNKLLVVKILSVILCFALSLFLIPGCGEDGGSGGAKSSSGVSKKKPVASFRAYVDVEKGTITFEYPDGSASKVKKGSAKKLYTSQPGPGMPGLQVIMASTGFNWDSGNKILSGNVTITNNTTDTLYGTYATIETITPSGVNVNNEYGYDPDGYPYFNHAPNGVSIVPSVTGSAVTWKFHDPDAVNFSFSGNVYADNWHQIAGDGIASTAWEDGNADVKDKLFIPALFAFDNKLYIMVGKQPHPPRDTGKSNDYPAGIGGGTGTEGLEIWEYEPTGGTFTLRSADGIGGSEAYLNKVYSNWGGVFAEYGGSLYAGTGKAIMGNNQSFVISAAGGEIWKWSGSGTSWTKVHSFTDSQGINTLHSFDGSLFAGSGLKGYGGKGPTSGRLDYSTNGTTWNIVTTKSFGDIDPQNTVGYGSTMNSSANISFGGSDYSFIQKSGITGKPGVTLYRAGPANGSGKGRLVGDWAWITDNTADDIYATITGVAHDNNPQGAGASGKYLLTVTFSSTPADHALAHHHGYNKDAIPYLGLTSGAGGIPGMSSVHILDNVGSQILYGPAGDHVPIVGQQLRLTMGANERGYAETSNATSAQLVTFATSSEGSASPAGPNSLWVFTSNLPQGVNQYNPSGANIYSTSTGGSNDSDWISRMNFFTPVSYPTPSSSGGAQYGGNVNSPVSVGGGFGNRSEFTFFAGAHEGWLYCAVMPFQTEDAGFRFYKTADGVNWIKVTDDGFGDPYGFPRSFASLGGKLYMGKGRPAISNAITSSSLADNSTTIDAMNVTTIATMDVTTTIDAMDVNGGTWSINNPSGVSTGAITMDTTNKVEGTASFKDVTNTTANRQLVRAMWDKGGLDLSSYAAVSFHTRCSFASSAIQFLLRDGYGNESYWNITTDVAANTFKNHTITLASPSSNNGTNADLRNLSSLGWKGLAASTTYNFDIISAITSTADTGGWSATGSSTVSLDTATLREGSASLKCVTDATVNREVTKVVSLDLSSYTTMGFYTRCSSASSAIKFILRDGSGNESYWNSTTSGTANTWLQHTITLASPDGFVTAYADLTNITSLGWKDLAASKTYNFDIIYVISTTGWAGTGVAVSQDPIIKQQGSASLKCVTDATANREVTKSVSLNLLNSATVMTMSFQTRCTLASSAIKFILRDGSGNESYWNVTTSSTAGAFAGTTKTLSSPDGYVTAYADLSNITSVGWKDLAASTTYNFDILTYKDTSSITSATTQFYEISTGWPTPTIAFPPSGTFIMEKTTSGDPVPESTITVEKVDYTGNKIATTNTLQVALPLNDGTLATHLWALDSQIIANGIGSLPTGGGAILIEGEIIQYSSISGSTISIATRGTYGSPVTTLYERGTQGPLGHGRANHAKGTPIYRTTGYNLNDYYIYLTGSVTDIPNSTGTRLIIIDNEKIWYTSRGVSGTTISLQTPMRGMDATIPSAHSLGTTIYKGGWTGLTRGLHGTTATNWNSGEGVTPVSFGSAELWVTD